MGTRVEQSGEFLPRAGRARRCHLEDLADSLHRLPSAAEDLQVIISCRNRALLLQGEFRITLEVTADVVPPGDVRSRWQRFPAIRSVSSPQSWRVYSRTSA